MKEVNIPELLATWTPEQIAAAQELTKKKMNHYKILTLVFACIGGIGMFLPFGKLAQLYTVGYAQLCGKKAPLAALWAIPGLFMSLAMFVIAKVYPPILAIRIVLPPDIKE